MAYGLASEYIEHFFLQKEKEILRGKKKKRERGEQKRREKMERIEKKEH